MIVPLISSFLSATEFRSTFSLSLKGGLTNISEQGMNSDYALGINHFPVVPVHDDYSVGLALTAKLAGNLRLEFDGNYSQAPKKVTLTDPSDHDEIEYKPLDFADVSLSFMWDLTCKRLQPYIAAGGGMLLVMPSPESETRTKDGYAIIFEKTPMKTSFFARSTLGLRIYIFEGLAFRIEGNYFYLPKEKNSMVRLAGGIQFF